MEEVQVVSDICELQGHISQNCPTLLASKEVINEQSNTFNVIPQLAKNIIHQYITQIGRII